MVHSTYHWMMKFRTPHEKGVVKVDQPLACTCYIHSVRHHVLKKKESLQIQTDEDPREERGRAKPLERLANLEIDGPEKTVQIGATLPREEAKALVTILVEFKELFA